MRRPAIIVALSLLAMASCSRRDINPADVAANVARTYYDSLARGNTAFFLEGLCLPDSTPQDYMQEMDDNMQMFLATQQNEHGGIASTQIASTTARHTANVLLTLTYGDSTQENIVVPMVLRDGTWRMR